MKILVLIISIVFINSFFCDVFSQKEKVRVITVPRGTTSASTFKKPDSKVHKIETPTFTADVKFELFQSIYDEFLKSAKNHNLGVLYCKKGESAVFEIIVNQEDKEVYIHLPGVYIAKLDVVFPGNGIGFKELPHIEDIKTGENVPVMLFYSADEVVDVENMILHFDARPEMESSVNSYSMLYYLCTQR